MECFTYLRNIQDLLSDGKTPRERRFGEPFKGSIIPFGSLVEYHPFSAKDQSRIHQFEKKVLPGLFLGYALYAGGNWKGDVLIADLEELETVDASEIYSKRLNAKEVIFPTEKWKIHFSSRRWTNKNCWRRSGTENVHLDTGSPKSRRRSNRFSSRMRRVSASTTSRLISLPQPHDSLPVASEAINDFWSMSGNFKNRHHVEPRVKLYLPREESFPIPL